MQDNVSIERVETRKEQLMDLIKKAFWEGWDARHIADFSSRSLLSQKISYWEEWEKANLKDEFQSARIHGSTVEEPGGDAGQQIIGVVELRAINTLLKVIDDAVERQVINSRSAIADARLSCCNPFIYFDGIK